MKNSLNKWKLNNNAIHDKNYLNTNKNFPSILLASKCVLYANVEEIFNTTQQGKKNSKTFIKQILQFNSNDYKNKHPKERFRFNDNELIPYSKNTVFITATNTSLSQKHCINYLKNEASAFYSQKESPLLSTKTKISFITFINPELFIEIFSVKNNLPTASKSTIKESLFLNTLFNIKDIGSFNCNEFSPNMILPEYTTTKLSKLDKCKVDPNLIKGILIQPKSISELNLNNLKVNEEFVLRLKFLISQIINIKSKETVEEAFQRIFLTYPKDIDISAKFWSIPLNKLLDILSQLLNKPLTEQMEKEFKNFCFQNKNV